MFVTSQAGSARSDQLHRAIRDLLDRAVAAGDVPGVASAVGTRQGPIQDVMAGVVRVDAETAVTTDTIFRLASMSKPLTSVAALQLVEQGRLRLDQEVATVLPEFAELQVLDGFDGDTPRLRPPRRSATVRELLNHTSGLGYFFTNADLLKYHRVAQLSTEDGSRAGLKAPLVADPGTRWEYGMSTDYLGLVVEAVAGCDLNSYLTHCVFDPLDMRDTTFAPTLAQRRRLMPIHYRDSSSGLVAGDDVFASDPQYWSGGGGAYGTARDYCRFATAILRDGQLDGATILSSESVNLMFEDLLVGVEFPDGIHSADPELTADVPFPPVKQSFALGLNVLLEDLPGSRRAGSGGWSGICNTYFWIDRSAGIAAVLLTQVLPFNDPPVAELAAQFERCVYESIRVL